MPQEKDHFILKPIGYVDCPQRYRYESPRQGVFASNEGIVRLNPGMNLENAINDLAGFSRIWILYCFHLNCNWRPLVRPPVGAGQRRIGVLATRSPHRPNPVGMSCVELTGIDGLELHIRNFDMLDKTPVIDIKPYIAHVDSFPDASSGWLRSDCPEYQLKFSELLEKKAGFIRENSKLDLIYFCRTQLQTDPLNTERKRIRKELEENHYSIGCRTWRIYFIIDEDKKQISAYDAKSSYKAEDLTEVAHDKHQDKDLHRNFLKTFS